MDEGAAVAKPKPLTEDCVGFNPATTTVKEDQ